MPKSTAKAARKHTNDDDEDVNSVTSNGSRRSARLAAKKRGRDDTTDNEQQQLRASKRYAVEPPPAEIQVDTGQQQQQSQRAHALLKIDELVPTQQQPPHDHDHDDDDKVEDDNNNHTKQSLILDPKPGKTPLKARQQRRRTKQAPSTTASVATTNNNNDKTSNSKTNNSNKTSNSKTNNNKTSNSKTNKVDASSPAAMSHANNNNEPPTLWQRLSQYVHDVRYPPVLEPEIIGGHDNTNNNNEEPPAAALWLLSSYLDSVFVWMVVWGGLQLLCYPYHSITVQQLSNTVWTWYTTGGDSYTSDNNNTILMLQQYTRQLQQEREQWVAAQQALDRKVQAWEQQLFQYNNSHDDDNDDEVETLQRDIAQLQRLLAGQDDQPHTHDLPIGVVPTVSQLDLWKIDCSCGNANATALELADIQAQSSTSVREWIATTMAAIPLPKTEYDRQSERLERSVQNSLVTFLADKTGMYDWSLAVVDSSRSLHQDLPLFNRLLQLWKVRFYGHGPGLALQPWTSLGQCWSTHKPSRVRPVYLVIQLKRPVFVETVSIEHPSWEVTDRWSSAIKTFKVFGYETRESALQQQQNSGWDLGTFEYRRNNDESIRQEFALADEVEDAEVPAVQFLKLVVYSNHGQHGYTCLYRVRVHGQE